MALCQRDLAAIDMSARRRPPSGSVSGRCRRTADIPPALPLSVWRRALEQRWILGQLAETILKHTHLLVVDDSHPETFGRGKDGLKLQEMRAVCGDDLVLHSDRPLDHPKPRFK